MSISDSEYYLRFASKASKCYNRAIACLSWDSGKLRKTGKRDETEIAILGCLGQLVMVLLMRCLTLLGMRKCDVQQCQKGIQ